MQCLLGLADEQIRSSDKLNFQLNKIGGIPIWHSPSEELAHFRPQCVGCGCPQYLVVQLYCALHTFPYHRVLYVFTCTTPTCWNQPHSWMVYRGQCIDKRMSPTPPAENEKTKPDDWGTDVDDWGTDADDWGTDACENNINTDTTNGSFVNAIDLDVSASNEGVDSNVESDAVDQPEEKDMCDRLQQADAAEANEGISKVDQELSIQDLCLEDNTEQSDDVVIAEDDMKPSEDFRQKLCQIAAVGDMEEDRLARSKSGLVAYFMNVFEEPSGQQVIDDHVTKLMKDYARKEGTDFQVLLEDSSSGSSGASEKYEKTALKHGDLLFHKFMKTVSLCPEQCVRYQRDGSPLYISKLTPLSCEDARCHHCGSDLVYELQLMPALVNILRFPGEARTVVEFGTVIVFTCRKSCWDNSQMLRSEKVIVQPDPDHYLFST